MVTTALYSRSTLHLSADRNAGTVLPVEHTSASLSLVQKFARCPFTHLARVAIRRVNTTWTRPRSTHAENSNPHGSRSTRSRPTSNPRTIPAKSQDKMYTKGTTFWRL